MNNRTTGCPVPGEIRPSIREPILMIPPEFETLLTVLILAGAAGIFLRLVGKEKHRRETWLQLRLNEKIEELKKAPMQEGSEGFRDIEATSIGDA